MSHENFGLMHEAPATSGLALFDFATKRSKKAADARRRAELRREEAKRAEEAMHDTMEWKEKEAALERVRQREEALIERDEQLIALKAVATKAKAAVARTDAAREFKKASKDVARLEDEAAAEEREATKALADGALPVEERARQATGADLVLPKTGKDASAGRD